MLVFFMTFNSSVTTVYNNVFGNTKCLFFVWHIEYWDQLTRQVNIDKIYVRIIVSILQLRYFFI